MSVYIITDGEHHKIGYTDLQVERRVAELQTGNPRRLVVVAVLGGGRLLEQNLHAMFAEKRVVGEWFKLDLIDLAKIVCWECSHCGASRVNCPNDSSAVEVGVRRALDWVRVSGVGSFSTRELHRAIDRNGKVGDVVEPVLLALVERSYVRKILPKGGTGRPSERYEVLPVALQTF